MTDDVRMRSLTVDAGVVLSADLGPAADWLRHGGIVAFPTDTVYGLAVDPRSADAVRALFDLKGRASQAALPLIGDATATVVRACGPMDVRSARLAQVFWPGPLSIILDAPSDIVPEVHAGTGTVAVRVPAHRVARALASAYGGLITATSANPSGQPPADRAAALDPIARDPRVFVVDAGAAPGGAPSTIVDVRRGPPRVIRAGAIAWNRVLESLQE
ncbi:MAG TPA: L-threonylcarbamoyladenylate synthase [Vicinamibacterales bacterium]|jgi:L-threonylcarbamoyladenylate synthase|nr:L-threonylcarbamoyladenylate synthase [Vicinamibacterales bacterium]